MLELLKRMLTGQSQFASGSLLLMIIGGISVYLRAVPLKIWSWLEDQLTMSITIKDNDGWDYVQSYVPRLLESVVLKRGEKEQLIEDVENFKRSQKRYRSLGVPYHRGYLFYGPPGTGKTSLVSAIAEKFCMSIYAINL